MWKNVSFLKVDCFILRDENHNFTAFHKAVLIVAWQQTRGRQLNVQPSFTFRCFLSLSMRDKKKDGAIVLTDRERLLGQLTIFSQTVVKLLNLGGFCRSQLGLTRAAAWQCPLAHGPQRYSVFCWELKWIFIFSCNKLMLMGLLLEKQFLNFICLHQQNASAVVISSVPGLVLSYSKASIFAIWTPIER